MLILSLLTEEFVITMVVTIILRIGQNLNRFSENLPRYKEIAASGDEPGAAIFMSVFL